MNKFKEEKCNDALRIKYILFEKIGTNLWGLESESKKMTDKKRSCGFCLIYLVVFLIGLFSGVFYERSSFDRIQMESIAERNGLQPTWDAIRNFCYCSILKYGVSKDDVVVGAQKIGYFRSFQTSSEMLSIYFYDPIISSQLGDLLVVFDEKGNLIYKKRLLGWDSIAINGCNW